MKKFLIGLITGLVVAGLTAVVLVFSLARFGERRPTVEDGSTLVLRLSGELPEKAPVEIPFPFGASPPMTVQDVWLTLRKAAADSRVKAVVVIPERLGVGWAKAQELRDNLIQFKKSGKPLVAFVRGPGLREYYIATAADQLYAAPEDLIDVKGLRAEMVFLRGTLDKMGVQLEVQHIGKYKDAGDTFTETTMSPETREVMNSVLDTLYAHITEGLASGRKRSPEQIRATLDGGPYTAKQALGQGLIDGLRFEDQVYGDLRDRLKQKELKKLSHREYLRVPADSVGVEGGKRIALLIGDGTITRGSTEETMGSSDGFSSGPFIRMVRRVANDSSIQGVILRVDSPGGDAIASDEILREVKLLSQKKPTVVSMSDLAASGGYYVAMSGDPVVAYPGTLTGSIGVIYGKANLRGFYDKIGLQKDLLTRGRNADIDTDYKPLSEEGRRKLQESLSEFYRGFVSKVAEGRRRPYEQMEPLAQGRVWLGAQARKNGLVDELGGLDKAIELVKRKAKIGAAEKIRLVPYPPKRTIVDQLLQGSNEVTVESQMRRLLPDLDYELWTRGGIMRLMPYRIRLQ